MPKFILIESRHFRQLGQAGADQILKKLIKPVRDEYDFILIDNGPTLGIATINSLVASEYEILRSDK